MDVKLTFVKTHSCVFDKQPIRWIHVYESETFQYNININYNL